MIRFVDESGSIIYCLRSVLVSCTVIYPFLLKSYVYTFFVKKDMLPYNVQQLLFRTRFFVLTKFSMPNGSHMDAHRIYYLTVVHFVQVHFQIRAPRC